MENILLPLWTESLIPGEFLLEPYSFENAAREIMSTTNVCAQAMRVLTKAAQAPSQNVSAQCASSKLSSGECVVHCKPIPSRYFPIRLELLRPPANWATADEPFGAPFAH